MRRGHHTDLRRILGKTAGVLFFRAFRHYADNILSKTTKSVSLALAWLRRVDNPLLSAISTQNQPVALLPWATPVPRPKRGSGKSPYSSLQIRGSCQRAHCALGTFTQPGMDRQQLKTDKPHFTAFLSSLFLILTYTYNQGGRSKCEVVIASLHGKS